MAAARHAAVVRWLPEWLRKELRVLLAPYTRGTRVPMKDRGVWYLGDNAWLDTTRGFRALTLDLLTTGD